jgi:hypothetical protein
MDLYALHCGGFAELQLGARVRAEIEAWLLVVLGRQWRSGDFDRCVDRVGGGTGSRHHGAVAGLVGGGGWAGDVDDNVEGAQAHGLVGAGLEASSAAGRRKLGSSANSSLP